MHALPRITYLCDVPWHAPQLARWHADEWHTLMPHWSQADALAELRTHTGRVQVGTTRVALLDGELAGSVSLVAEDHPQLARHTPWLASLFVRPDARRHGIGRSLVRALVEDAHTLGLRTLYLFTEDGRPWYEQLGWQALYTEALPGGTVTVMSIDPAAAPR